MKTIRTFLAIPLTDEATRGLARLQEQLKDALPPNTVRWTVPENIHLTLHFLGDVEEKHIETIVNALNDVSLAHSAFSLELTNLGCFPSPRRPRIVWVGLSGETRTLIDLQQRLGKRLKDAIGFLPDSRSYSPHLTIGRVKKGVPQHRMRELGPSLENEIARVGHLAALPVHHIRFVRSDLRPSGPIYTTLAKANLAGSP